MQPKLTVRRWWRLGLLQMVFLVLFLFFFGGAVYSAWDNQRQLHDYRPVKATILRSWIAVDVTWVPKKSGYEKRVEYTPFIVYRYEVAGVTYERGKVWPTNNENSDKAIAEEALARYHVGNTYTAYYDPANPDSTYLEPLTSTKPYIVMVMAVVMTLPPIILVGIQQRRESLLEIADSPTVTQKRKRQAVAAATRYKRRYAILGAGGFLAVSLCSVMGALSSITPSAGSPQGSAMLLRGMFILFAIVMAGGAWLIMHEQSHD